MARWRISTLVLIVVALVLWAILFGLNLRPELGRELSRGFLQPPDSLRLQAPLSRLPAWAASLALFVTLFLAGAASLFLYPLRVRNMARLLGLGWSRALVTTALGIGFGLLMVLFGIGAALARITFPLTILSALVLFLVATWGFLVAAYALGHLLLSRAGWGLRSPVLGLALGLLLLLPLARIPFVGGIIMILYVGLGLGLAITTRFGSNEPWSLIPLLEEVSE
jgi:hypothetical protein